MKTIRILFVLSACAVLAGCVSRPTSATWWNPLTWMSGREGRQLERAQADQSTAREAVIKAAQKTAHETAGHLALAAPSLAVANASESNGVTVGLLDQAAGPLSIEESNKIRAQVTALNSELESVRATASAERSVDRGRIADMSTRLGESNSKLQAANESIAAGFTRENALANQLRNERLAKWAGVAGTILMGALAIAWRMNLGGLQKGVGDVLGGLRARYGVKDEDVIAASTAIDAYTSPRQQATLANLAAKAMVEALKTQAPASPVV